MKGNKMKQNVLILKADDSKAEMHELESDDGQPSFKDVYPLINTNIIEIAHGRWIQKAIRPRLSTWTCTVMKRH